MAVGGVPDAGLELRHALGNIKSATMTHPPFLDLRGVSGARYRFHHVPGADKLPAEAGNFVFVRDDGPALSVVCCGTDDTLVNAAKLWPAAQRELGAQALFVRRNIARKIRVQEHLDLVKQYKPQVVFPSDGDAEPRAD